MDDYGKKTLAKKRTFREISTKAKSEPKLRDLVVRVKRLSKRKIQSMIRDGLISDVQSANSNGNADEAEFQEKQQPRQVFVTKSNTTHKLIDLFVRVERLTKNQIDDMIKNVQAAQSIQCFNDNDNEGGSCIDSSILMRCPLSSNITSKRQQDFGIETRSMKRKHCEVSKTITEKKEPNKKRRVKNLTIKEKIRIEAPDNEYVIDEIVLATIPGFCAWPARIQQIIGETIMVEFFGTGEMYGILTTKHLT